MDTSVNDILIYVGFALLLIGGAMLLYRKDILFLLKKKETDGIIVNWMSAVEKGVRYYYPMIEFSPDGITRKTFRAEERCENQPMFSPGTKVKILFLPSDPEFRKVIYPS
jgi:hypothetical protein